MGFQTLAQPGIEVHPSLFAQTTRSREYLLWDQAGVGRLFWNALLAGFRRRSLPPKHPNQENFSEVLEAYEMLLECLGDCDIRIFAQACPGFLPRGRIDPIMIGKGDCKRMFRRDSVARGWAIRGPIEARTGVAEIIEEHPRIQEGFVEKFLTEWSHSGSRG